MKKLKNIFLENEFFNKMEKLRNLKDKGIYEVVSEELEHFNELIEGHKKLLVAIGKL